MRSLAIILYLVIMGCLVLAYSLVGYIDVTDYYKAEVEEDYIWEANLVSRVVLPELYKDPEKYDKIIRYWKQELGEQVHNLKLIDLSSLQRNSPESSHSEQATFISEISITEYTDLATVIVPLDHPQFTNKALQVQLLDAYSDRYLKFDISSEIAIYVFMGLVISVIALVVYRYMRRISVVTQAVASGNFSEKMPANRIHSLQVLADDINSMSKTIEEKVNENIILTGAIHHELRIPITRVRLALDMALAHKDIGEIKQLLTDMDIDLEELTRLMEEILTISRLSLTSEKIPTSSISVKDIVEAVVEVIDSPLISIDCETDFTLSSNKTLFERAIHNVITNAQKYAEHQVSVTIKKDRDSATIEIEDDGPGIPKEEWDLVLKPFYRPDKSRNRNTGGFGLGLAIADMVVKHTNGRISISDSEPKGTKVSLQWAAMSASSK